MIYRAFDVSKFYPVLRYFARLYRYIKHVLKIISKHINAN